jgi:hypothetical protein
MVITLQGIFRDGKIRGGESLSNISTGCKFFVRQFTIVPKTEGYFIFLIKKIFKFRLALLSDILQITPVSTQRMEHYNNLLKNAVINVFYNFLNIF